MKSHAYTRVAARLRDQILASQRQPAEQLPAERELCAEFGVSRITIRHALRLLAEEGLLQRRHGSGTYVKPNPSRRIPLLIDYTGSMREHAPRLRRRVLVQRWTAATADMAHMLGSAVGSSVLYAERIDEQDATPVAWDQAHIAAAQAQALTAADLAHVDFIETWMKRAGFAVQSCRQQVEAVPANRQTADCLGLRMGAPVLKSAEVYFAAKDQPAGWFVSYYHPQHICVTSWFRWKDRRA